MKPNKPYRKSLILIVALAAVLLLALCLVQTAMASTLTVTSTADDGSEGTLRSVLEGAADDDTIDFDVSTPATINLDWSIGPLMVDKNVTITGPGQDQLTISGQEQTPVFFVENPSNSAVMNVTISGLTIANGIYEVGGGVFNLGGTVTISDCTLRDNFAYFGGAIFNIGTLMLTDCTLSDNVGIYGGGAVCNGFSIGGIYGGTLIITGSTLSGNLVYESDSYFGGGGGAILNFSFGTSTTLTIENSTLKDNNAYRGGAIAILTMALTDNTEYYPALANVSIVNTTMSGNSALNDIYDALGGAIFVWTEKDDPDNPANAESILTVDSSTLSGNSAQGYYAEGGAISIYSWDGISTITVKNSTLSGNSAQCNDEDFLMGVGGAIINLGGMLTIDNSTLSGNWDDYGISGIGNAGGGEVIIKNTILANDPSGLNLDNPDGTVTSNGYNLCSDGGSGLLTATGDLTNTDPMLGPLADNGGPTLTHALLPGSPAIDAGSSTDSAGSLVEFDQRGVSRPQGSANDIGAFEAESSLTISDVTVMRRNNKVVTVTVQIDNPNETTAYGVTVTIASLNGSDTNSSLPLVFGSIKPGTNKKCTLQFKDVPPGDQILRVYGHCSLGVFFTVQTVPVP